MANVSVIVPNYNHAPYLRQRIESILCQRYQDIELILLDDCSTDASRTILESYRHHAKVSHIVYNHENSGNTFLQWEQGIRLATGNYIWLAESDDWATDSFLESLLAQFALHPTAVIAFCQSHLIDESGRFIQKKAPSSTVLLETGNAFIAHQLLYGNAIYNASMCVFKKSAYAQINAGLYTDMRYCGDWFLWSLLCQQGDVVAVKQPLNYFRKHRQTVSLHAEKQGLSILEGFIVFTYNRTHIPSRIPYFLLLIPWTLRWAQQCYPNDSNRQIRIFFKNKAPLVLWFYPFVYLYAVAKKAGKRILRPFRSNRHQQL
jgi:glycosyltransferase involved in cell wall biosynthesis